MPITDPMREFDSRTFRRKIKSGRISESDYNGFMSSLPDVSDNIKVREDGGDDDGYEERIANRGRPRTTEPVVAPAHPIIARSADPFTLPTPAAAPLPKVAAPIIPRAASPAPLPIASFDLPPLDPPMSPPTPSSSSGDDEA